MVDAFLLSAGIHPLSSHYQQYAQMTMNVKVHTYALYVIPHTILVQSGKAIGMLQVCKENGNMTINLNGRDDCYSELYSSVNFVW